MKTRITHIDNAKAIGIMLIIASHIWTTKSFSDLAAFQSWDAILNSFYVPLFFIISGIFESSSLDWNKYLKRLTTLVRHIFIFLIFGFVSVGLINGVWNLISCLRGTVVWFLIVLLWITVIMGIVKHFSHNYLYLIILTGIGISLTHYGHSYGYIGQALLCLPFYYVGYKMKNRFKLTNFDWRVCLISLVGWLSLTIFFYKIPQNISLNMVSQSFITFYISAFFGAIFMIELSKLISGRFLPWYGRNSIVPMLVQMVFICIIAKYILVDNMVEYFCVTAIVCLFSGICIPLFRNKYYDILK